MFKQLLVATDGSEHSKRSLEKTVEMVSNYKEQVTIDLLYVVGGQVSKADVLKYGDSDVASLKRKELMKDTEDYLKAEGIATKSIVLHGEPAPTIIEYANDHNYDCVIVGSRGKNQLQTMVLGSVSHKVVKYAKAPVLVVK
ncbi:universal stress protein [Aquibacillus rhizosphaerae]|uniref:Universal stress protein n=1 Tax=Aquibacillus rhizosphaerae TaxID=3051431 RepID=A0ABT7L7M8_9BACI|nr:universal stress protein [Aquibacillus sp. LR5S19]MDL4841857.1 universal stress protein [Aquibacillus sp. LR5S19]